ncbi:MAG: ribosomal subunit interface protein [Bdellovibrionales bacterium CG10_big_fil_rev_8_21_14_0_10_45_34]|nr:MAG: ribosomal subunit interface protein [Bdellovibrionales bacterium CG10_big_fil_rev_8_21_14_0_10_45_34]
MNVRTRYQNMEPQYNVELYLEDILQKLKKYQLKPFDCQVTICHERSGYSVKLLVSGPETKMSAHANDGDLYSAIESVVIKMQHQLSRRKGKVQYHKRPALSASQKEESLRYALEGLKKVG